MYIARDIEKNIEQYLSDPEVIAIIGPRRSGKTTLLKHFLEKLPKALYLTFDDPDVLELFNTSPKDFITAYLSGYRYVCIDEFQYASQGGKILKYLVDTTKLKFIISGSSTLELTIQALQYLLGRVVSFELYPFSFHEFLLARDQTSAKLYQAHQVTLNQLFGGEPIPTLPTAVHSVLLRLYEEYIIFGGYPRIVLEPDHEKKTKLLRSIYQTFFLREVHDILGLTDDGKLHQLIKALALQIGQLLSYQELGQMTNLSYPTLKKYLHFLEQSYLCRLVLPWSQNERNALVKNPKPYFIDTGLRNAIVHDMRRLADRPDGGSVFENSLMAQAIKRDYLVNFWRNKRGHEIDLILGQTDQRIAIEAKLTTAKRPKPDNIKQFKQQHSTVAVYQAVMFGEIPTHSRLLPGYLI